MTHAPAPATLDQPTALALTDAGYMPLAEYVRLFDPLHRLAEMAQRDGEGREDAGQSHPFRGNL